MGKPLPTKLSVLDRKNKAVENLTKKSNAFDKELDELPPPPDVVALESRVGRYFTAYNMGLIAIYTDKISESNAKWLEESLETMLDSFNKKGAARAAQENEDDDIDTDEDETKKSSFVPMNLFGMIRRDGSRIGSLDMSFRSYVRIHEDRPVIIIRHTAGAIKVIREKIVNNLFIEKLHQSPMDVMQTKIARFVYDPYEDNDEADGDERLGCGTGYTGFVYFSNYSSNRNGQRERMLFHKNFVFVRDMPKTGDESSYYIPSFTNSSTLIGGKSRFAVEVPWKGNIYGIAYNAKSFKEILEPAVDENGKPVLDGDGKQILEPVVKPELDMMVAKIEETPIHNGSFNVAYRVPRLVVEPRLITADPIDAFAQAIGHNGHDILDKIIDVEGIPKKNYIPYYHLGRDFEVLLCIGYYFIKKLTELPANFDVNAILIERSMANTIGESVSMKNRQDEEDAKTRKTSKKEKKRAKPQPEEDEMLPEEYEEEVPSEEDEIPSDEETPPEEE
jgi:hypothetical protein